MVKQLLTYICLLSLTGCTLNYDLDMKDMGTGPGYFVECYCIPGEMFNLTATRIAPIAEDQLLDYSMPFETWITTNERFRLWHSLFHEGKFVYNYGSDKRLDPSLTDSIRLEMQAPDGTHIWATTHIPPQAKMDYARLTNRQVEVGYTPQSTLNDDHRDLCYILSIYCWGQGRRIDDVRFFRDHVAQTTGSVVYRLPDPEKLKAPIDSITVELRRMTREGYRYQLSIREAANANYDPMIQPPPLHGNISGALGVFTCYTRDTRTIQP